MTEERVVLLAGLAGDELEALGAQLVASGHFVHRLATRGRTGPVPPGLTIQERDSIAAYVVQLINRHGRLDAVVLYAAETATQPPDLSGWMQTVQDLVQMIVPVFRTQGHGLILNVVPMDRPASPGYIRSEWSSRTPDPMRFALAGAMKAFIEALATGLRDSKIRALFISPARERSLTRTAALITTLLAGDISDPAQPVPSESDPSAWSDSPARLNFRHSENLHFRGAWRADEQDTVIKTVSAFEARSPAAARAFARKWTFVKATRRLQAPFHDTAFREVRVQGGPSEPPARTRSVCYAICRSDAPYPAVAPTLETALQRVLGPSASIDLPPGNNQVNDEISI